MYREPNQKLKYLNLDSTHSPVTFKVIYHGVALRLAQLTLINDSNQDKSIGELYPVHLKPLQSAGLCKDILPSASEIFEKFGAFKTSHQNKKTSRERNTCIKPSFKLAIVTCGAT